MATPINDLPAAGTLTGAEEIAANQSGNTVKITTQSLATFAGIGTAGLTTQILVGGGTGNAAVWTTATGSGAPVRATSPTLVTPVLGAATATSITLSTDLAIADGGTGQSTAEAGFNALSPLTTAGDLLVYTTTNARLPKGAALQALRMNGAGTAVEWSSAVGDALTTNPLSQFATTSSAQLRGVMSDETGTGALVFGTSPTLVTPTLGAATATSLTMSTPLAIADGGTGNIIARDAFDALSPATTEGDIFYRNNSHVVRLGIGTTGQALLVNGAATAPVWTTLPGGGDALTTNPLNQFAATTSDQLRGVISDETGTGLLVFATGPTLSAPALGTPASGTLTNCTGLPAAGVAGTALVGADIGVSVQAYDADLTTWAGITPAAGVGTFLANPSAANLETIVTDNTGSGSLVFATSPALVTPSLGVATATSINKVTITQPATSSTLTIQDGFTLTANGNATVSGTNTGDQTNISGNAATVTVGDAGGDTTTWVLLGTSQTGSLSPATDAGLTYNATTDALTATTFVGALTGTASGNLVSGGALGTPSSGTLTNCTGLPIAGTTGYGTGVATALAVNVGSAGAFVTFNGALGTPSSGTLTNCTGLPIAGTTGYGTGVATALAINVGTTGAFVAQNGALGTPSSGVGTNFTGTAKSLGIPHSLFNMFASFGGI